MEGTDGKEANFAGLCNLVLKQDWESAGKKVQLMAEEVKAWLEANPELVGKLGIAYVQGTITALIKGTQYAIGSPLLTLLFSYALSRTYTFFTNTTDEQTQEYQSKHDELNDEFAKVLSQINSSPSECDYENLDVLEDVLKWVRDIEKRLEKLKKEIADKIHEEDGRWFRWVMQPVRYVYAYFMGTEQVGSSLEEIKSATKKSLGTLSQLRIEINVLIIEMKKRKSRKRSRRSRSKRNAVGPAPCEPKETQ